MEQEVIYLVKFNRSNWEFILKFREDNDSLYPYNYNLIYEDTSIMEGDLRWDGRSENIKTNLKYIGDSYWMKTFYICYGEMIRFLKDTTGEQAISTFGFEEMGFFGKRKVYNI
jgi:hypothetical protein